MNKRNIAVIFGGCSSEYQVSLQSAYSVMNSMDGKQYVPICIGISQEGNWYRFAGDLEKIKNDTWNNPQDCIPVSVAFDRRLPELQLLHEDGIKTVPIDAAFPVLHGKNGEDGTVQGIFELAGIPVVGCGLLSSALCLDKDRAHKLAQVAGITVPKSYVVDKNAGRADMIRQAENIGYPLFVKPVKAGSSLGISKVNDSEALAGAIELALHYDDQVIIEESIAGFEVGCAILGNEDLIVGEVDEIELTDGFFDFREKYTQERSTIYVPARTPKAKADEIKEKAQVIYRALGCHGFARVDMFLTPSGEIVFNEVNTIPGFTSHSRFPKMLKAVGLPLEQVVTKAIELAVAV